MACSLRSSRDPVCETPGTGHVDGIPGPRLNRDVPRFLPFPGIRYRSPRHHRGQRSTLRRDRPEERAALEARDPHNAVRLDPPRHVRRGRGRARHVARRGRARHRRPRRRSRSTAWTSPVDDGSPQRTTGVLGALRCPTTTAATCCPTSARCPRRRPTGSRCCARRAPTSTRSGASRSPRASPTLLDPATPRSRHCVDADGVDHALWRDRRPRAHRGDHATRSARAPLVLADGHHRFETALQLPRRATRRGRRRSAAPTRS